ncbi:solute carrier family 52, riboflavin transporter, member 3-B-like [Dreissena polymorpha]|uniref:Riboflavin transporter n=1 Tax=Dreissena polymorpha TaxID=45954 RepID=A0A9D4LII9_DREPO|nr:solute carrier family 52, riboflavin transporter, member 3-B-like [Dreissena polymorpha]XP_052271046.1 solute carrier family 52, riboflavin transporter, member 3-B-like [Dreissena polymorpha]XP_052271047.1 solute carrier family 52, riboflavin transporter, member 3-B-like [Dreissena polymorpha]KAH3859310.1 hypothetical protein DPMN_102028 [Dreissena polymorpha]
MKCLADVRLPVYILVILFGMGSWIAVNGLWVELPLLVDGAPEGWNLPSYIIIIIQAANIGPLLYTLINKLAPNKFHEKHGAYIVVICGAAGCLMLVFLWKKNSYIGGVQYSTGMLCSVLLLSMADCTSSVVFLPYMSLYKREYITALYIGEGLSGLLPSLVALGQSVGKTVCVNETVNQTTNETQLQPRYLPPHFPVEDFFYFLLAMMVICGLAFTLLHYLPYCKQEHASPDVSISAHVKFINADSVSLELDRKADPECDISVGKDVVNVSTKSFLIMLFEVGIINALTNGVLSSVSSYATLPYGNQAFHLANTLSMIANPLACGVAFFLPVMSQRIITMTTLGGVSVATYILVIASYSPQPPLYDHTAGAALIVIATVLVSGLMSFSKVSIASVLRSRGRRALLWCGIVTQIGSALGAILMFIIVNVLKLFHSKYPCT